MTSRFAQQQQAPKTAEGERSCADDNWRRTEEGNSSSRGWREEMTPRFAQQQQAPKTAVKRRDQIERAVVEEKRDMEFGGGGFNQAVFWKDPLPEISCKELDLLSNDSEETSDDDLEEVEEVVVKLRKQGESRKVDNEDK